MCWLFYWLLIFSLLHLARERLARFNCWSSLEKFQNTQTLILSSILCRDGAIFRKIVTKHDKECPLILCSYLSYVPLSLCTHWSNVLTNPIYPTDPVFQQRRCTQWSNVPTDPMLPLILCFHWSCVPTNPMHSLIPCSLWSYASTDPTFPLILCIHWSYVPTDFMHPLILCSHWFYVSTDPMIPLILCSQRP